MNIRKILLDPKTVVAAVAGGFVIGLTSERLGAALMPIGTIYITFLSMCLIPILITAIVQGIARLLRDPNTRGMRSSRASLAPQNPVERATARFAISAASEVRQPPQDEPDQKGDEEQHCSGQRD